MQSFAIYGGKAGLYDYGPPGCAIKANVEQLWREHFIIAEDILEISCTNVTPEDVLKTSGHVEKFSDLMVRDTSDSNFCFRADHLIEEHIENALKKEAKDSPNRQKLEQIIKDLPNYKIEDIANAIKTLGIKSPKTGKDLSEPYPFNLMFEIQIGPAGDSKGYLRPETAQGMFVNFKNLLDFNGGRMPFGCAQIGLGFRNEIAPRSGLLRLREFCLAEIEFFVDPQDKNHVRFNENKDYVLTLFPREKQATDRKTIDMKIGEAVEKGIINNQTLAYFMARTHNFLIRCGIKPEGIRFRQHMGDEMAHYSTDCWDAEVLLSYGWVEMVGIADRSAYDLTRHGKATKKDLVAARKFSQAKLVKVLETKVNKQFIGKTFKQDAKVLTEYLENLEDPCKTEIFEAHNAKKEFKVTLAGKEFIITSEMITFEAKEKNIMEEKFVPNVIEPAFGIGRIIYALWEHNFKMRSKERTYFHLPAKIAPYKVSILTVISNADFEKVALELSKTFKKAGISNKLDLSGQSIGKRYARTDEVGVPFGITIDHQTLTDHTVTLREIDTCLQIADVTKVIYELSEDQITWEQVTKTYPEFKSASDD